MQKYLVTGGCGFIGSKLANVLVAKGHHVRILDDLSSGFLRNVPAGVELIDGDVADSVAVAEAMHDIDGCFHLAAVASVERGRLDWVGTHRTNLTGTITILDTARRVSPTRPIPVVYASSAAVYGDNPNSPLAETASTRPLSAYGADKLGCEQHARVAGHVHGVPTCGLRFFNVYGPGQNPSSPYSGVVSIFSSRLQAGHEIVVHGDGRQVRDFVFVEDVVRALLAAMNHVSPSAKVFNVCTGRGTSILDLATVLADLFGTSCDLIFGPHRAGDIRSSVGNPSLARRELAFQAQTDLRDGLLATVKAQEDVWAEQAQRDIVLDVSYPASNSKVQVAGS
jgi:UDP-glucose 4-epimerase